MLLERGVCKIHWYLEDEVFASLVSLLGLRYNGFIRSDLPFVFNLVAILLSVTLCSYEVVAESSSDGS